ncbi:MAG: DUF1501 domain-containing protein [Planctomycetota bacterium]|jgi:hypothetical protein|nr:MAG: DUF1501 domain-containing protein [Planctomycetota bacterium]
MHPLHFDLPSPTEATRRMFLSTHAGHVGLLALASMLAQQQSGKASESTSVAPDVAPKAKSVICLFQNGGPSQMDLFDPKPELQKWHGQPYPAGDLETHFDKQKGNVLGSPYKFRKYGESGMELCELLPHTGSIADEITLIRSMKTGSVDHEAALRMIHSGRLFAGMPSFGSWISYALGTENRDLPSFVVLSDPGGLPIDGEKNWSSGWLPAVYQGTVFRSGSSPVLNLQSPEGVTAAVRRNQLDYLGKLNRRHASRYPENSELTARIANFETAARMQTSVPELLDLSGETKETRELYGLDNPAIEEYGARCLTARKLIEQGVRFVGVYMSGQPWDTHSRNAESLKGLCARTDQPSAALVKDLKQRGLLDSTIVIWTGEFGRLPISQGPDGRDHNRHAFSSWIAGGGFKQGCVYGATDPFGYASVENIVNVHDLHATMLASLGLDHTRLAVPYDGRDTSLTDAEVTHAKVVHDLLA